MLTLLSFVPMLLSGCQDNAPEDEKSTATAAERAGPPKISIDDLLARTDLNDRARKAFERSKTIGQDEMAKSVAEKIIKHSFLKKEVLVSPKTYRQARPVPQPTLSRNEQPTADYDTSPLTAEQWLSADLAYLETGVDHFDKRFVYGLTDDVRADAAAWMREVIEQIPMTDNYDQWRLLYEQAATLAARAEQLKEEPMFCLCRATAAANGMGEDAALEYFSAAMLNFRTSDYPTRIPICCYHFERSYAPNNESKQINYETMNVAFFHWIENDFRAVGHEQRFAVIAIGKFIDWMLSRNDRVALAAFETSVTNSPLLTAWTKAMLLGDIHYKTGYHYRGSGYANSVSEENMEKLEEHCKIAEQHFVDAYQLRPEFHESTQRLTRIARFGFTEEDEDYWFDKGIEYEPHHLSLYRDRLFGLYPRWGGSHEKMLDFLLQQTKDTDNLTVAFLLPSEIFKWRNNGELDTDQWQEMIITPKVTEATLAALDTIISSGQNVTSESRVYLPKFFITLKAIFAAQAKQYSVAEEAFDQLGDQFSKEGIRCYSIDRASFGRMRSSVYAFTSEYQAEAFELEQLWGDDYKTRHKNADKILKLTDGLAEWVNTHSGGLYFKYARNILLGELNFENQKLPLTFDEDFTVWKSNDFSQIKFNDSNSVEVDNRTGGRRFQLKSAYQLPHAKIFECDLLLPKVDIADLSKPDPSHFLKKEKQGVFQPSIGVAMVGNSYLMIGVTRATKKLPHRRHLPYNGVLSLSPNYTPTELVSYEVVLKPDSNRIKIAAGKGYVEVYLNDVFICRATGRIFNPVTQVSFEQPDSARGRGTIKISNPSIRRWPRGGPDIRKRDPEAIIAYYEKAIVEEPDDVWHKFWLGQAKHLADDFEGALENYQEAVAGGVTPRIAGYYLGDAYDQLGKHDEAVQWYRKSIDPKADYYASRRGRIKDSPPEQWAAFRLRWNLATKATLSEKEKGILASIEHDLKLTGSEDDLSYPSFCLAEGRLLNDNSRSLKRIQTRLRMAQESKELRELLQPVLDALTQGKPYIRPESQPPLYLHFEDDLRFFY